jgi:hypothetical protein
VDEQSDRLALLAEMEERGERDGHEIADSLAIHHNLMGLFAPQDSLEIADHAEGIVN